MIDRLADASDQQEPEQEAVSVENEQHRRPRRVQMIVFCTLLVLALVSMAVTQSLENGG